MQRPHTASAVSWVGAILAGVKGAIGKPIRDEVVRLRDGRALAYAEWGAPHGRPVFFFHGTPHSRLWCPEPQVAVERGVRVMTVDRPGFGRSDPQPGHRMTSWPDDVAELAYALGAAQFGVVGWSAGAKNAVACAAKIPDRLSGVAAVSGFRGRPMRELPGGYDALGPEDRETVSLAERDPAAAVEMVAARQAEWGRGLADRPEAIMEGYVPAEGDRWFFADTTRTAPWYAAITESFRQGTVGYALEDVAEFLPWGFSLADIDIPVRLFHGEQDHLQPREDLDFWARTIPRAQVTVWPDAGHQGISKHWDEILDALAT